MPHGRVERVVAAGGQLVGQLLDPRLVGHRRPGVRLRAVALGGVLAAVAVDLVEPLGLACTRARSRRRSAARPARRRRRGGARRSPPAAAGTARRRTAWWRRRRSSGPGLERLAVGVVPGVLRDVLAVDEHRLGVPVVHLPGQEVAPLEEQDPLAGRRPACGPACRRRRRCR